MHSDLRRLAAAENQLKALCLQDLLLQWLAFFGLCRSHTTNFPVWQIPQLSCSGNRMFHSYIFAAIMAFIVLSGGASVKPDTPNEARINEYASKIY